MPVRASLSSVREAALARPFVGIVLTCAALAGGLMGAPDVARACTYVPVNFSLLGERMPVSGPLIIDVDCQQTDYCKVGAPPQLRVLDGTQEVEGSLEVVRGELAAFLVWRPTAPLQQGREYRIEVSEVEGSAGGREFTVRADPAFAWAAPAEPSWSLSDLVADTGERFCCFAGQACFDHCFTEQRIVKAVLTPELTRAPEQAATVYALRWREADGTTRELGYRRPTRFQEPTQWDVLAMFDQPAQEYCATLEVRNLVDGRSQEFSRCFTADPAVTYGESVAFTPDTTALRDCQVPPGVDFECQGSACDPPSQMYLRAWCDANRTVCSGSAPRSYCDRHASFCDGLAVEQTSWVDAGATQAGPSDNGRPSATSEVDGCTASPAGAPFSSPLWLLALALWRRRRSE